MQCFLLPFPFGGAAQGSDHAALNPIYADHLTFGGWPQEFASTDIWINLRIKGGLIMALERLERPRRKVLGQEPHPALARTRALPRKINRKFGDSADGEPGGAWGGGRGGNGTERRRRGSFWRMFHCGRLDDSERMASGNSMTPSTPPGQPCALCVCLLAPLAAPFLGRPDAEVWGLGSGFRLRTVHLPPSPILPYSVAPRRPFRLPHQQ